MEIHIHNFMVRPQHGLHRLAEVNAQKALETSIKY